MEVYNGFTNSVPSFTIQQVLTLVPLFHVLMEPPASMLSIKVPNMILISGLPPPLIIVASVHKGLLEKTARVSSACNLWKSNLIQVIRFSMQQ